MVRRETDPAFINRVANSASVRPFIDYRGVDSPLDLTPAVGRPAEVGMVWLSDGEDALACFVLTAERTYQAHVMFGERCRGRKALDTAEEMLAQIEPSANLIWGAIPMRNRRTRWFARKVGFVEVAQDHFEAEGPVAIMARVH